MKKLTKEILNRMMSGNVVFEKEDFIQVRDFSDYSILIDWINKNTLNFATPKDRKNFGLEEFETEKFEEFYKNKTMQEKLKLANEFLKETPDYCIKKIITRKCDV